MQIWVMSISEKRSPNPAMAIEPVMTPAQADEVAAGCLWGCSRFVRLAQHISLLVTFL